MVTLESVALLSDQKQKIEQYRNLLNGTLASGSREECEKFVDHSMFSPLYQIQHERSFGPATGHDISLILCMLSDGIVHAF